MFPFGSARSDKTSVERLNPIHLASWMPKSSWDGWFGIAVFPPTSPLRWLKAHFFHRHCAPGKHPLASFEGMDRTSEALIVWATTESITVHKQDLEIGLLQSSPVPLKVEFPGHFSFKGEAPDYWMEIRIPDDQVSIRFEFRAGWPIWWSRWGRFLHYIGQHSSVSVELVEKSQCRRLEGLGVVEHVCGMSTPFVTNKITPIHWHWDVLSFGTSPLDSGAGLSLGIRGRTFLPLRAAARIPGHEVMDMRGLRVRYNELAMVEGPERRPVVVSVRWEGLMKSREGVLHYRATAKTPTAFLIPDGGMLGFDLEGEWRGTGGSVVSLTGSGFTEYADFSGYLVKRV